MTVIEQHSITNNKIQTFTKNTELFSIYMYFRSLSKYITACRFFSFQELLVQDAYNILKGIFSPHHSCLNYKRFRYSAFTNFTVTQCMYLQFKMSSPLPAFPHRNCNSCYNITALKAKMKYFSLDSAEYLSNNLRMPLSDLFGTFHLGKINKISNISKSKCVNEISIFIYFSLTNSD